MKTGFEFIQRIQEDAEFRRKVNACSKGEERLAFLKKEGYDFSPFIQILNNLSSGKQSAGGWEHPAKAPAPGRALQVFRSHQPNISCHESPRLDR